MKTTVAAAGLWLALLVPAQARPVLLELFTSEACSSCPPADALLTRLAAQNPNLLALSFHVTYWNGPAWNDRYALQAATDRQTWYAGLQNSQNIYTPEAIIDGMTSFVGSDRGHIAAAIAAAQTTAQTTAPAVPASIKGTATITIVVGNTAATGAGQIWLFGYDPHHITQIGGGENGGATLTETNTVRSITSLGQWIGGMESFTIPRPAGAHTAIIVQTATGAVLGAAAG